MINQDTSGSYSITLPRDTQLPFFAYGSLKPKGPAHYQIQDLLDCTPTPATILGTLWVRDGLPLLKLGGHSEVEGFLLQFRSESAADAYETICRLEPRKHYQWMEDVSLGKPIVRANVLVGKMLERGRAVQIETNCWTLRDDPVFTYGIGVVREVIRCDAGMPFDNAPPASLDWPRLFRLQAGYLLLWSAVERYTALFIGAGYEPMARINRFGKHQVFKSAFHQAGVSRKDSVCDSRDPKDSFELNPSDPSSAILYYYQVRNNLSHRGKGAWAEGEIVRKSLVELVSIFDLILNAHNE